MTNSLIRYYVATEIKVNTIKSELVGIKCLFYLAQRGDTLKLH